MLKPAIATVSLGRSTAGHGILAKLRRARLAGFDGVEVFFECLESLAREKQRDYGLDERSALIGAARAVRTTCEAENLTVVTLQPFLFYDGLVDQAAHLQKIETLHLWFKICHILNTDLIQIPTNFQRDGTTGQLDRLVSDLALVAQLGLQESPPIRFAYEGISWGTHVSTWEGTWEVVRRVNLPNLGLCLDTFHIAGRVWGDPTVSSGKTHNADEALKTSLDRLIREVNPEKIFYVQLSDAERMQTLIGPDHPYSVPDMPPRMIWSRNARLFPFEVERGAYLPIWQVCQTIFAQMKWQGWVSMEVFNRTLQDENKEVAVEHAARASRAWRAFSKLIDEALLPTIADIDVSKTESVQRIAPQYIEICNL